MWRLDIYIPEKDYYAYYMGWVKFHILQAHEVAGIKPFVTQVAIHCRYDDGKVDSGRHLSPIYRTITSVTSGHPLIYGAHEIISF